MVKWTDDFGNQSLTLGKGLIKININWRLVKPDGYDVYVNSEKVRDAVEDIAEARKIAIEYIRNRLALTIEEMKEIG